MKIKKFNESISNITKVKGVNIRYFDLFPLLKGLESERPGIKDRIWGWMCEESPYDIAFRPYNGRISFLNLFYYGVGDEYKLKYTQKYPGEIEHSKRTHPEAFMGYMGEGKGSKEIQDIRLDLNLILYVYQDEIKDGDGPGESIETFPVLVRW